MDTLLMWKVFWLRTQLCLQKEHINVSLRRTMISLKNRQQQRQLLKTKFLKNFDAGTEQKMGGKKKTLNWLVEQIPNLIREIEDYRSCVFNPRKNILRLYTMVEKSLQFYSEATKMGKELRKRKFRRSKQAFCSKVEQLVTKLDTSHAEIIRILKTDTATDCLKGLNENKYYHRGLLKPYQQTAESGNQTLLLSSTSAVDKDSNKTVIDTSNGAIENAEVNVKFSSRHSAEKNPVSPTLHHREGDKSTKWGSKTKKLRKKQSNDCKTNSWS